MRHPGSKSLESVKGIMAKAVGRPPEMEILVLFPAPFKTSPVMSSEQSDATSLTPGQTIGGGRYSLVRELGRGGMGVVWLAQDKRLEEPVALKFLPPQIRSDPAALDDMRRETRKSRKLTHPNIIRIHDLFESPGEPPFISMEYVDGTPLHALKSSQPQQLFSWEYLKPLVKQLCEALDYAHEEKVIHRDLKPSNLMLDSRGRLKLADFGIASAASDSLHRLTRDPGSSGTPLYMSPQQMNSQAPRVSDDIYSLGAALYELLTSKPPFYTGDIFRQVQDAAPTPLDERLADLQLTNEIPSQVGASIMACLAKEREQRPASASAVAERLGIEVGGTSRQRPPATKRKFIWTAAGLTAVALLVAGIWSWAHSGSMGRGFAQLSANKRWTNSLGMIFVAVPRTEVLFSIWETRVQDYAAYAALNRGVDNSWQGVKFRDVRVSATRNHPVVNVSWNESKAFCDWLTKIERDQGRLSKTAFYRLPTDSEWSASVGLTAEPGGASDRAGKGNGGFYPWGNQWPPPRGGGNFWDQTAAAAFHVKSGIKGYKDGFATTSPVGNFAANPFGIYDLAGNVWEWCEDKTAADSDVHIRRGGSWHVAEPARLQSSYRDSSANDDEFVPGAKRGIVNGFRVVLVGSSVR